MPSYWDTSLLWVGVLTFLASLLMHVLVWRITQVKRHFMMLLVIHLGIPATAYLALGDWHLAVPLVLHIVLGVNYIAIYPAFQAASPTIRILAYLKKVPEGVPPDILKAAMLYSGIVDDRIRDLKRAGLLSDAETPAISRMGRLLAVTFLRYRILLGLPVGGG